jgi:hypothetical protein
VRLLRDIIIVQRSRRQRVEAKVKVESAAVEAVSGKTPATPQQEVRGTKQALTRATHSWQTCLQQPITQLDDSRTML